MDNKKYPLEFRGGMAVSFVPLLILIGFAVYFFGFAGVYDTMALGLGGLVALIIGSFLAKSQIQFWNSAIGGMADQLGNVLALILLVVGVFGKMMTRGHIAEGFIWIGDKLDVSGSTICVFAFITTAIIATSTGTSMGTIMTMIPVLLPVGALMDANMTMLVGAILSGALFGDSLGPVSDVTIASSQTQPYRDGRMPDIGGVVKARYKYSLIAGALTVVVFIIFGGGADGAASAQSEEILREYSDPKGLLMLIPMVILLYLAFRTRSIFIAASVGIVVGSIIGIASGIMTPADILIVQDGAMNGFIIDGILNMIGTVLAVYMIVAIIGILKDCGMMDRLVSILCGKKGGENPVVAELKMAIGTAITCLMIGSMNGPSCLMFGPIASEVGQRAKLHPYRRANIVACFSSSLPIMFPFSSVFVILTMGAISGVAESYPFIEQISPLQIPGGMVYCVIFPLVFLVSIFTGIGRRYEGKDHAEVKTTQEAI